MRALAEYKRRFYGIFAKIRKQMQTNVYKFFLMEAVWKNSLLAKARESLLFAAINKDVLSFCFPDFHRRDVRMGRKAAFPLPESFRYRIFPDRSTRN